MDRSTSLNILASWYCSWNDYSPILASFRDTVLNPSMNVESGLIYELFDTRIHFNDACHDQTVVLVTVWKKSILPDTSFVLSTTNLLSVKEGFSYLQVGITGAILYSIMASRNKFKSCQRKLTCFSRFHSNAVHLSCLPSCKQFFS